MFSKIVSALALISSTVSAATITIQVGDGGFIYTPNSVTASKGDIVSFQFSGSPGNHTVSQAAFDAPCAQLQGGFDSNFVFIPTGFNGPTPSFNLTIEDDTKPIWFYCKQTSPSPHCISGMVGSINAPSTGNTTAQFQRAAMALSSLPSQTPGGLQGVGASANSSPSPLQNGASLPSGASSASSPSSTSSGSNGVSSTRSGSSSTAASSNTAPANSPTTTTSGALGAINLVNMKSAFVVLLFTGLSVI